MASLFVSLSLQRFSHHFASLPHHTTLSTVRPTFGGDILRYQYLVWFGMDGELDDVALFNLVDWDGNEIDRNFMPVELLTFPVPAVGDTAVLDVANIFNGDHLLEHVSYGTRVCTHGLTPFMRLEMDGGSDDEMGGDDDDDAADDTPNKDNPKKRRRGGKGNKTANPDAELIAQATEENFLLLGLDPGTITFHPARPHYPPLTSPLL
jgi:hypothetical protein